MKDNTYIDLVNFWDQNFMMSEEDKKELLEQIKDGEDYKSLAPSIKQYEALTLFKDKENVLDYGAGSGWASIIMAKEGTKKIKAVDVSKHSIEALDFYKKAYKVDGSIKTEFINENWIKQQNSGTFDGFFSSNVIDVVPLEMAKDIIKESRRIVSKDALVVYSLNFYIEPKLMENRGAQIDGPHIYLNNVLRLTSLTDEEWIDIFKQYFEIISLSYFAWPNEEKETRRLFVLKPLNK